MAAISVSKMLAGVGEVWAEIVAFFDAQVAAASYDMAVSLGTSRGLRRAQITGSYGGNTYTVNLLSADIGDTRQCGISHISSSPGWRARPAFVYANGGSGAAPVALWRGAVLTARRAIWTTWAGASLGAVVNYTHTAEATQCEAYGSYFDVSYRYETAVDALLVYGRLLADVPPLMSGVGPSDGLNSYPAPVSVQLHGIETGIADLNNSRLDVSLNNGAVVVSAVGGTNIT